MQYARICEEHCVETCLFQKGGFPHLGVYSPIAIVELLSLLQDDPR